MTEATKIRKKRTQRDYNLAFKLAVVEQVEKGELTYRQAQAVYGIQGKTTVLIWLRKHGTLDWNNLPSYSMNKEHEKTEETPAQKIKRLEKELEDERLKNEILNRMIDIADRQYGTQIKKKYFAKQSDNFSEKEK